MKACKGPGKTAVLAWLAWNFLLTRAHPKIAVTSITAVAPVVAIDIDEAGAGWVRAGRGGGCPAAPRHVGAHASDPGLGSAPPYRRSRDA